MEQKSESEFFSLKFSKSAEEVWKGDVFRNSQKQPKESSEIEPNLHKFVAQFNTVSLTSSGVP